MAPLKESELTEAEKIAKEQFKIYFKEAYKVPCDLDDIDVLPEWYDEAKYKRGQEYFFQNRSGILNINLVGLICLLAEPKGLKILASTGKSTSKEGARKRYISTVIHTLTWYEIDLTPGSKSRKSLATVRKLHFAASNSANEKSIGYITQSELALTAFGFMGLALIRPEISSIHYDNQEDVEAFVHLWAVLCHMIGVKEKYNICLLPLDALKILCQMFTRYILIPIIQIESPLFKSMTTAMLDGLNDILPYMDYEVQLFYTKLILGLPGYQQNVKSSEIQLCRSIFNQEEINELNEYFRTNENYMHLFDLSVDIPIIEVYNIDKYTPTDQNMNTQLSNSNVEMDDMEKRIHTYMELKSTECVKIYYINYEEEWESLYSNEKFYKLSSKAQNILNVKGFNRSIMSYKFSRYLGEKFLGLMLERMKRELKCLQSAVTNGTATSSRSENRVVQ